MSKINDVIEKFDYDKTNQLFFNSDNNFENIPSKYRHIFLTLQPYAVYFSDNKPLVAFFEVDNILDVKKFYKQVWNSQIPIVMIEADGIVKIYNGCSINSSKELELVDSIKLSLVDRYTPFSFWNITKEDFWNKYERNFLNQRLDISLLENIKYITNYLKNSNCNYFANKLILRLIFIRFLIDRGVDIGFENLNGNVEDSQINFLNIVKSKNRLYDLFKYLKTRFNGNLFDLYFDEFNLITDSDLNMLGDFLSGSLEINSGQYSLFPMYDFNIIPIELISNIYERFLGVEKQKEDSAFYTPPYLVDYIIKENIYPFLNKNNECKVLDPSCGSGIFLVQTLRAIIEKNIGVESYCNDDEKLVKYLTENIYGIDKNGDAIDVAIFSLYLTLLDYKNPKTLKTFTLPNLKESNFLTMDFFDERIKKRFNSINFDFIIGNPPWGNIDGLHVKYCRKNNYYVHNNEISRSFIYRTKDFSDNNTKCCLIVTSKLLYNTKNPSKLFRNWFLKCCKINKIIELSPVRELIFKNAKCPAVILSYQFKSDQEQNDITHITLMPNMFFKLFNIIVIERNNIKKVKQKYLIENDWLWKTIVFGNSYDFSNILYLKNNFTTLDRFLKENKILCMTGIQLSGNSKDSSKFIGKNLISARNGISAFYVNLDYCEKFVSNKIHRTRNEKIFEPPYVLLKKGFDIKTYKLRSVYTEDEFLYTDAITGIKGTKNQRQTLLSIVGNLNSSLYSYLNLMLGSSAGIEREQSFTKDVMSFPVVDDVCISKKVEEIQALKMAKRKDFTVSPYVIDEKVKELDNYVLDKFGLSNNNFIDYALTVQLPQITGNIENYKIISNNDLSNYSKVFIDYFSELFKNDGMFFQVNWSYNILNKYCEFRFEVLDHKTNVIEEFSRVSRDDEFIYLLKQKKYNNMFYENNDIIDFGENYFRIIKTYEYKNWHPACAEIDLAYVINEIMLGDE